MCTFMHAYVRARVRVCASVQRFVSLSSVVDFFSGSAAAVAIRITLIKNMHINVYEKFKMN